jgi:DNA-binding LytR/AlgR family response regulator
VKTNGFARAHRQALVRLDAIRELARGPGSSLVAILTSGVRVPVSRRKRARFASAVKA